MLKRLRVSLIIPVYNEAASLAACLCSVAAQDEAPYEVIVVDNNSTDATVAIARSFPFVTVLHEPKQGVVHARNTGFDAAQGDIIGRIDADSRLPASWVSSVAELFAETQVAAFSGSVTYHDILARKLVTRFDLAIRKWLSSKMSGARFLLGCNMAVRRSAWRQVRRNVCSHGKLHEDLDLAAHLSELKLPVAYEADIQVGISGRRADTGVIDFIKYLHLSPKTYALHGLKEHWYMYPVIGFVLVNYGLLRLFYRACDVEDGHFSIRTLLGERAEARVNPAL